MLVSTLEDVVKRTLVSDFFTQPTSVIDNRQTNPKFFFTLSLFAKNEQKCSKNVKYFYETAFGKEKYRANHRADVDDGGN